MSVTCAALPARRLLALPAGVWSISWSVMTNQIMLETSMSSIDLPSSSSSRAMAPRHCCRRSGVSWMPIQPARSYFATRSAERFGLLSPLKKIGGGGLLDRLRAEPARVEVGELAVVFEEVVRPDALHDLDRLAQVLEPLGEDVRGARGRELLGHPAGPHAHVEPAVRQVVDRGELRRQHTRRAVRRVGDAHADPYLLRLRGEPGDQRPALIPLAAGGHRQLRRELLYVAERVLQLTAVGSLRN